MTSIVSADLSAQVATVRRLLDTVARGDQEAMRACFTEEFVFHVPGDSRVSGDHRGWVGYLEFVGLLRSLSNGTFHSETLDVLVGEHTIVMYQRNTAEREGKRLDFKGFYLLHFDGDRIASIRSSYEDQSLLTEFWG